MDAPSWTELVVLLVDGPDLPVHGVLRSTGGSPAGWFACTGGERAVVTGTGPEGDLQVWRDGAGLRTATTDGRVLLVADAERTWSFPDDGTPPVLGARAGLVVAGRATQLLFRRTLDDLAVPAPRHQDYLPRRGLLRPAGPIAATELLGRPAWTVELPQGHHLVVDAATGLVLQERWADAVDEWVELTIGESLDAALFAWDGPTVAPPDPEDRWAAEREAEQAQQRAWLDELLGPEPVLAELDLGPSHVRSRRDDGGFDASLGAHLGIVARRPRSRSPWDLEWRGDVHRWSTARWDWAVALHDGALTPDGLAALQRRLADRA